jgi:glycine/D-amino acid oxidase-like deaminating enzyme
MTILSEDFVDRPYWWDHAPPSPGTLDHLPERCDVAVIGSGYAGLRCALTLARAGRDVVVLEAGDIGSGASSRNAGLVSGRAGVSKQIDLAALVGDTWADRILQEADEAFLSLQGFVGDEGIACHLQMVGRFVAAHTPRALEKIDAKMAEYNRDGRARFSIVARDAQDAYVHSRYYYGGMYNDDAGLIHPTLYHKGIRHACERAGVRLISGCRVSGVETAGTPKTVVTEKGALRAGAVALATNGYTDSAVPWHRRRSVSISSTVIATEVLGHNRVLSLLPKLCTVIDAKRVINFARPSPDGQRILFGGRAKFAPVGARESASILHRNMITVFPELEDVRVTHAWSGLMGFTFDFLPKLGVHDGIHYAIGCNGGCGISLMSWLGQKMGERILDPASPKSAFEDIPFKTQPFYAGAPWFVPLIGRYWTFRDWLDMREIRRRP